MPKVMVITVDDIEYRLAADNIPLGEKEIVLQQTKRSFESWMSEEAQGELSLAVLWWLARRSEGERKLSWTDVKSQWPSDMAERVSIGVDDDDESDTDSPE
jgi:hypothetical protein